MQLAQSSVAAAQSRAEAKHARKLQPGTKGGEVQAGWSVWQKQRTAGKNPCWGNDSSIGSKEHAVSRGELQGGATAIMGTCTLCALGLASRCGGQVVERHIHDRGGEQVVDRGWLVTVGGAKEDRWWTGRWMLGGRAKTWMEGGFEVDRWIVPSTEVAGGGGRGQKNRGYRKGGGEMGCAGCNRAAGRDFSSGSRLLLIRTLQQCGGGCVDLEGARLRTYCLRQMRLVLSCKCHASSSAGWMHVGRAVCCPTRPLNRELSGASRRSAG